MRTMLFLSVVLAAGCFPDDGLHPAADAACNPLAPEGRCECDGGVPGVEVCGSTDAGLALYCRCNAASP